MKTKVLILYNRLLHYRLSIFNILAEKYDLTVAYNYGDEPEFNYKFKRIKLHPFKLWKFTLQHENIFRLCQKFDVVVTYGETAYLKYSNLALHKDKKFKLIYWTIGAPASYTRKYGEANALYFKITDFFNRKADALVLYSDAARQLHIKRGFNRSTLFVANNTVKVAKLPKQRERNSIMFIGTLYPQKGLPILLDAYKAALLESKDIMPLNIVGSGILSDEISNWIKTNNLSDKIHMLGPLYSTGDKSAVFSSAYACISPNQAGLAVLESMGYGVPFITSTNAITGGEAFNIKDGVSGRRLDDISNLKDIILDISGNPHKYELMGEAAYDYYWSYRKPEDMANGLVEAIEYAMHC